MPVLPRGASTQHRGPPASRCNFWLSPHAPPSPDLAASLHEDLCEGAGRRLVQVTPHGGFPASITSAEPVCPSGDVCRRCGEDADSSGETVLSAPGLRTAGSGKFTHTPSARSRGVDVTSALSQDEAPGHPRNRSYGGERGSQETAVRDSPGERGQTPPQPVVRLAGVSRRQASLSSSGRTRTRPRSPGYDFLLVDTVPEAGFLWTHAVTRA